MLNASDQAFCTVQDVSRAGIGLHTGQPPLCGQRVRVRLGIGDEVHELQALTTVVSRIGMGNFYHVGLDWSDSSPVQLAFLDRVLAFIEVTPAT